MIETARVRRQYLTKISRTLHDAVENAPEGRLIIRKGRNTMPQLYLKIGGIEHYVKYTEASDAATKRYHVFALKVVDAEIKALDRYLQTMPKVRFEQAFSMMPDVIKPFIAPSVMTDEEYVRKWQAENYIPKKFSPMDKTEYYTKKGERVRSKSEVIIANALYDLGIPYKYERPLVLYGGKIVIHPDFTILNIRTKKEYYLEHCGKMDSPDYAKDLVQRLRYYNDNGIFFGDKLLFTCETDDNPLSTRELDSIIRHFFL